MTVYSARWVVVLLAALGLSSVGVGAWLFSLPATPLWVVFPPLAAGLLLVPLAALEWRRPVLELEPTRLVLRAARLRAPLVVTRPAGTTLEVQKRGLLLALVSTDGARWVDAHLRGLSRDDGKCLLVPTGSIGAADRARLETALRAWAA